MLVMFLIATLSSPDEHNHLKLLSNSDDLISMLHAGTPRNSEHSHHTLLSNAASFAHC